MKKDTYTQTKQLSQGLKLIGFFWRGEISEQLMCVIWDIWVLKMMTNWKSAFEFRYKKNTA